MQKYLVEQASKALAILRNPSAALGTLCALLVGVVAGAPLGSYFTGHTDDMTEIWPMIYENIAGFVNNPIVRLLMIPGAGWLILHGTRQVAEAETKAAREETAKREEAIAPLVHALGAYNTLRQLLEGKAQLLKAREAIENYSEAVAALRNNNDDGKWVSDPSERMWQRSRACLDMLERAAIVSGLEPMDVEMSRPIGKISPGLFEGNKCFNECENRDFLAAHDANAHALKQALSALAERVDGRMLEVDR